MSEQEKVARCLAALEGSAWDKLLPGPRAYWFGQAHKFINLMADLK